MQFNSIQYTYHALEEVKNELASLGVRPTNAAARAFIEDNLQKSTYISEIMNTGGKIDRLFSYRRFCFVLDREDDCVITVYRRENVHAEVREAVQEVLFEKLDELDEQENRLEDERKTLETLVIMRKELNAIGASNTEDLREGRQKLKRIEREVYEFRLRKSRIAKGIAAYL